MQSPCPWKHWQTGRRSRLIELTEPFTPHNFTNLQMLINLSHPTTLVAFSVKHCINPSYFNLVRITIRLCTAEFTRCTVLSRLVLGIPSSILKVIILSLANSLSKPQIVSTVQYSLIIVITRQQFRCYLLFKAIVFNCYSR